METPSSKSKKPFVLPSDRAAQQTVVHDEKVMREARIRQFLNSTFGTPEGVEALRYLQGLMGIHASSLVVSPASLEVCTQSMLWNEAKREMYVNHIRPYLHEDILIKTEINKGDSK